MTPRVLVTGAGGFIGRWSVPPLLAAGYQVHAVLRPEAPAPAQLEGARVHRADLLEPTSHEALCASVRPTHLLHFAWIATPGLYWHSPDNERWRAASLGLLNAFHAAGGRRAVMAGSCAEYDWARVEVCHERSSSLADCAVQAPPAYTACKIALQRSLEAFGRTHGIATAWGRIFLQYGPHEHRDRLVSSAIVNLLQGRAAPATHGRQVRSFLHAADVGAAFAALLESRAEGPVNVGSSEATTIGALLQRIADRIGGPGVVRLGAREAPPGEPAVLLPDTARLEREIGWRPRYTLDSGLADTIAWWRGQLARDPGAPRDST